MGSGNDRHELVQPSVQPGVSEQKACWVGNWKDHELVQLGRVVREAEVYSLCRIPYRECHPTNRFSGQEACWVWNWKDRELVQLGHVAREAAVYSLWIPYKKCRPMDCRPGFFVWLGRSRVEWGDGVPFWIDISTGNQLVLFLVLLDKIGSMWITGRTGPRPQGCARW